jgi:penicillin-binding protein 1A
MGRDDARPVGGLQGGTAPARAFHDFMSVAVANRPVEQFETQVPIPDWQLTPEEEIFGDQAIDANGMAPMVDENGLPLETPPPAEQGYPQQQPMVRSDGTGEPTQQELDPAIPPQQQSRQPTYPQPPARQPPQRQPQPESTPPPDPSQPRPQAA